MGTCRKVGALSAAFLTSVAIPAMAMASIDQAELLLTPEDCAGASAGSELAQRCVQAANQAGVQDIVVTARRRAESLQRVPESVTAFSEASITELRLTQVDDFLGFTPNVNITNDQDAATNNISIRGLGSNRNQAAAVVFAVDGVILPDADAFTMDLSDASRVEVLRGPQGALYGKGAIAGAINITTRRPTNVVEGDLRVSYESGDMWRVFGAVGGPIVDDLLVGRVSVTHREGDGTLVNRFDDRPANPIRQTRVGGRLIFTPGPVLELDLRANHFDERAGSNYFVGIDVLGTTGGEITRRMAEREPMFDGPARTDRTVTDVSLLANAAFGFGTFSSITAYNHIDVGFAQDLDISPHPLILDAVQFRKTEGFSQEFRFTSPGHLPLRYIVGAYYQRTDRSIATNAELDLCLFLGTCFGPAGVTPSGVILEAELADHSVEYDQWAVFAQVNYDILDSVELTAALRWDHVAGAQQDRLGGETDEASFSRLQPKFTVAYRPTPTLTAYATYSQGFKSGAFNPVSAGAAFPRIVEAEVSKNYELGLRTSWLNRRLVANAAAFYTQHLNPQIFQLDPATFGQGTLNAREVSIRGFELEFVGRPTPRWDINAAFGYVRTRIEDFDGATQLYVGQQMPNAPEFTLNLGTGYTHPIDDRVSARVRADYRMVGRESFQDFQYPIDPNLFLFQRSFGTIDAQAGLEGTGWALTVYARNLFDRRHATAAFSRFILPIALVPAGVDAVQPDFGRIIGAEARFRF
jgi:iron complex outermembrane recepter protein